MLSLSYGAIGRALPVRAVSDAEDVAGKNIVHAADGGVHAVAGKQLPGWQQHDTRPRAERARSINILCHGHHADDSGIDYSVVFLCKVCRLFGVRREGANPCTWFCSGAIRVVWPTPGKRGTVRVLPSGRYRLAA